MTKIIHQLSPAQPQAIWPLAEVKDYLRISHDYDDRIITSLIDAAISEAENFTNLLLLERRITLTIISSQSIVKLRYAPLQRLLSAQNSDTLEDITERIGHLDLIRSKIILDPKWIDCHLKLEYLAGYRQDIPKAISHGILLRIAAMYDRSNEFAAIDQEVKNLYLPFRPFKI